ncbi:HAMP domain-containing sensor histidine kinase [Rurimicrobium arvi]|uniref:histidine kinase n=1 Tax=Rurimicrobium arvi TaxID=2049916 RepID=A0ABP8MM70_9BACT
MKLVNKFTLWYLAIVLACTVVGTMTTYHTIKYRIDKASTEHLKQVNRQVAEDLKKGKPVPAYINTRAVSVTEVAKAGTADEVSRVCGKNEGKPGEAVLTVSSYHTINNKNYKITTLDHVPSSEEVLTGLEISIIWKWAMILGLIGISARFVSRIILGPFKKTLKQVDRFNLAQKQKLEFEPTNTAEFRELNAFLKKMTDKAVDDYVSLKEFSENASHELQTPVAIMRGKLELLMQSGVSGQQAAMITDVQNAVEKLSRINSSLTLLARLENHEYHSNTAICISEVLKDTVEDYEELIEMKGLSVHIAIEDDVQLILHKDLLVLLLNNLLSNAIRHNITGGRIEVFLNQNQLTVRNTGPRLEHPSADMFQRFKKGNKCEQSVGIGLAIVKQICELHRYALSYATEGDWHILSVGFKGKIAAAGEVVSQSPLLSEVA